MAGVTSLQPPWVSTGDPNLIGVALDGFPIYGTNEEASSGGGAVFVDSSVDNGRSHSTSLFSSGVAHYHVVWNNFQTDSS